MKNAKTLVNSNELSGPMFIRILPIGGSSGYFSDILATGIWYAMFVIMLVIWISNVSVIGSTSNIRVNKLSFGTWLPLTYLTFHSAFV